jgi:hypothetical protein
VTPTVGADLGLYLGTLPFARQPQPLCNTDHRLRLCPRRRWLRDALRALPRYLFKLAAPLSRAAAEDLPDDAAAKLHACRIADEINRHGKRQTRVLVQDDEGNLLAVVSPIEE